MRFKLNAVYVLMALLLYFLFVRFGLETVCAAAVFAAFAFLPLELRVVNKLAGIGVRDHLRNLWPATLASIVMTAAIIAAKQSFMAGWNDGQTLAACLVLGAVVYGLSLLCADRSLLSLLLEFLRQGPLRRSARGSGPLSSADSGNTAIGAEQKAV